MLRQLRAREQRNNIGYKEKILGNFRGFFCLKNMVQKKNSYQKGAILFTLKLLKRKRIAGGIWHEFVGCVPSTSIEVQVPSLEVPILCRCPIEVCG